MVTGRLAKILLIDTNVYFSKRLGDALNRGSSKLTRAHGWARTLKSLKRSATRQLAREFRD